MFLFKSSYSIKNLIYRSLFVLLFGLCIGFSRASDTTNQEVSAPQEEIKSEAEGNPIFYKNGKYIGISEGWTGMELEVTILKGRIAGIQVSKVNGTPEFYQKVVDQLPDRIISKGSPDVDGISGATLSSNSMKEAINHALEKAIQNE